MKRYLVPLFAMGAIAAAVPATAISGDDKPLYTVKDGYFVDDHTYEGFKVWRAAACDRCHGPNQEGMVGPSLIESLKVLSYDQFKDVIMNGRLQKGMPNWSSNKQVVDNLDALYAYLKGRSDGEITKARVRKMEK
ncbi:c-type cytochrome [Nitrogeniibacter aestuarii]|uniref:c-type cytochrome n=1 Tax=Nitrogeniibacter aestuarii TaxID=2815343 RepID=UPI001D0FE2A5|nr:cytochrome c [Nitrogeniibacter aestuarii]